MLPYLQIGAGAAGMFNGGSLHNTGLYRRAMEEFQRRQMEQERVRGLQESGTARPGDELGGWEARRQGEVDIAMGRYGMNEFGAGGRYAPERLGALYRENNPLSPDARINRVPTIGAPSIGAAQRYGYGAMDMAGRAAALQTGVAGRSLEGLNPAARASGLAQIAQSGAGSLASAGVQGYGAGLSALQNTATSNQSARMAALQGNQQAALSQDQGNQQLFSQGLNNTLGAAQFGAGSHLQAIIDYWNQRNARNQAREQSIWGSVGSLFGAAGEIGSAYAGGGA